MAENQGVRFNLIEMRFGRVPLPMCILALLFATATSGADDALVVSREEALRLGAKSGPGVATAQAPLSGLRDARDAASSLLVLPPQVTLQGGPQVLPAALPSTAQRVDATFGATAMMLFPLRGVGTARKQVAEASIQVVSQGLRRTRLDTALRGGIAWSRALEVREIHKLRIDALVQTQGLADIAKKRIGAGVAQPVELALALGEVGAQRVALLEAEGWMTEAYAELRLATGLDSRAHVDVAGDLCVKEPIPVNEEIARRDAFGVSPEVPLAEARAELFKRDTHLVSAVLGPTFGLGASYQRDGAGDHIVQGIVSIPIPLVDYGAFDRARTGALAAAATSDIGRVRAELDRDVVIALHDVEHTREVRDTLETAALVPLEDALRLARLQYEAGTQDMTLVLAARQRTLAAREAHARSCGEVLRADMRLLRVAGALVKEAQ
jgi:outer membrane protein TolC